MTDYLSSKKPPQKEEETFSVASISNKDSLLRTISEFDRTFLEDRGQDMGDFFAEDAQLMFPHMETIIGRESIRETFVAFVSKYTTDSWSPNREFIDLYERRAYILGSFIELRTPLDGSPTEKVYGRLMEIWQLSSEEKWEIIRFMSSRYADTEFIE